jgi:amino acid transporter
MKKLLLITIIGSIFIAPSSFAQTSPAEETQPININEQDEEQKEFNDQLQNLFPTQEDLFGEQEDNQSPGFFAEGDLEQDLLPRFLRLLVIISGTFITVIFTYVGFRLVLSRDDEAELTNLKNTFAQVVIGTVLILSAFGIVVGIIQYFDSLR